MCDGQDMECFPIKGNGHPVIDRELYTPLLSPYLLYLFASQRIGAPNIVHIVPLVDSGPSDFLA